MRSAEDESGTRNDVIDSETGVPARPPGGKPMLRLLQHLKSQGLDSLMQDAVVAIVEEEHASEVFAVAERFAVAPAHTGESTLSTSAARPAPTDAENASATRNSLADAYREAAATMGPPTGPGPRWQSIGPHTITNGQTYGNSRINVSGRLSAVAVDPAQPTHVLAGSANGGVWESRDAGASWLPRTDYQTTLSVGALAFDPNNGSIAYCGTGEGAWWGYTYLGNGILRSTDGGTTWMSLCTAPFVGQGFFQLVVDRTDGQRLYAATTGGLYVSSDGGSTWTQRRSSTCWGVSVDPAGTEVLAACRDGLFSSTDDGTTWTAVALPGAPANFFRFAVSIAPSNAAVAYAWGARLNNDQSVTTLLWRRNAGAWNIVAPPADVNGGQAWYDWYVAAAPDRDTQVYLGAIDLHRGDLANANWTWTNLSSRQIGDSIHPDQQSIAFAPGLPDTVYAGNDGGLFRSPDRGVTWVSCNNGLVISEFEYIAQDIGTSRLVIGGTQDNGTNRWLGLSSWEHVGDADGGDCGVNRGLPTTMVHTRQNGTMLRSTTGGALNTWNFVTPPRPSGEAPGLFYVPVEYSAAVGDTVALGGLALYVSRDNATNWTRLAYPAAGTASALHLPDPDTVVVGLTDGRVLRSRFSDGDWSALTALAVPRAAWISDLYATPGAGDRLWVTSSAVNGGRVFRSDDSGSTWTDRTAGLPNLPITAIAVDDTNPNRVWVGADLGVYQSSDGGVTWAAYSNGLPTAYVGDLIFHPHARVLRAGTRNRGVWQIPVDGWQTDPRCGTQWTGALAARETKRWFTFRWPATWHVVWTVMPTTPSPGAPQVTWNVQVERASAEYVTYWISVTNLTGVPITFEGRYAVLSRY
ncbi:WD40/YVTN/BNR-like repeat-containing protein [Mycetocola sp.]|uniref:WD40/YVTN/BNR-like repeat-containing protein n=1 Tax=Mycetocola sp. TaxID=1871042 RepID=UPI003988B1F8